jgi:hypothetical protein
MFMTGSIAQAAVNALLAPSAERGDQAADRTAASPRRPAVVSEGIGHPG